MNIMLKKTEDKILTFSNIAEFGISEKEISFKKEHSKNVYKFDKSKIKEYNILERSANGL